MPKIVFDIETAGEDFDQLDEVTKEVLAKRSKKGAENQEQAQAKLEQIKESLVFSPLTAQIVAIGALDAETKKGAVYFQDLSADAKEFEEEGIKFKPLDEKAMLESFWNVAGHANVFISFNGRGFDAPFLCIRSAIHGIKPSKNLLSNRYLNLQPFDAKHVDLMDQLSFYGAVWGRSNLHLACRAFGIKSPKAEGINGDDVTRLFREGKYQEIARYNARDLKSTCELFERWDKYLRFK